MRKGRTARLARQQRALDRLVNQALYAVDEQEWKAINDMVVRIQKNMGRQGSYPETQNPDVNMASKLADSINLALSAS